MQRPLQPHLQATFVECAHNHNRNKLTVEQGNGTEFVTNTLLPTCGDKFIVRFGGRWTKSTLYACAFSRQWKYLPKTHTKNRECGIEHHPPTDKGRSTPRPPIRIAVPIQP